LQIFGLVDNIHPWAIQASLEQAVSEQALSLNLPPKIPLATLLATKQPDLIATHGLPQEQAAAIARLAQFGLDRLAAE